MTMHATFEAELRKARETWQESDRPPEVTAVAAATGLDPERLWDVVEGQRGWESHNAGYEDVVWAIAWEMRGYPDWAARELPWQRAPCQKSRHERLRPSRTVARRLRYSSSPM